VSVETSVIWEEFRGSLRRFISSRVRNDDDAEDILQDVFLKIHKSVQTLEDEGKLRSWIYQITRNAIIDYYRKTGSPEQLRELDGPDAFIPDTESDADVESEVASWLEPFVAELSDNYREALTLTEFEGLTQVQLAERLGISVSGAKSRVQRARGQLKELLTNCCHFEFDQRGKILDYQPKGETYSCCTDESTDE
jgi:RNA polymerase sigma-70 factor (ECF subfamily)